jgi:hypothetical protein
MQAIRARGYANSIFELLADRLRIWERRMVRANDDILILRVTTPAGLPGSWIMVQTWNDLLFAH